MKRPLSAALAVLQWAGAAGAKSAERAASPLLEVVNLLRNMEATMKADAFNEGQSYDKYACWCEDAFRRKEKDMAVAKARANETESLRRRLSAELGSRGANVERLKEDLAEGERSKVEAEQVRDEERSAYQDERRELESCIGALEAATRSLTGVGVGRAGFLGVMQEAEAASAAVDVRGLLARPKFSNVLSGPDLKALEIFAGRRSAGRPQALGGLIAIQTTSPFGDYAPQSTQIQGILKSLYENFVAQLEKANAEEADKEKSYQDLVQTKREEFAALKASLDQETNEHAQKARRMAKSKLVLDEAKEEISTIQAFVEETTFACREKATQFATRSRLRAQELSGLQKALSIVSALAGVPTSAEGANASSVTFLQLTSPRGTTTARFLAFAASSGNAGLAAAAAEARAGSNFTKIAAMIDRVIESVQAEREADIDKRDRCMESADDSQNRMEDLAHDAAKAEEELQQVQTEQKALQGELKSLEQEVVDTKKSLKELLDLRNGAVTEFRLSLRENTNIAALIDKAIAALGAYRKAHPTSEPVQRAEPEPFDEDVDESRDYIDPDLAPETTVDDGSDFGHFGQTSDALSLLASIKRNLMKDIDEARRDDAEAQRAYEKQRAELQSVLDAKARASADAKGRLADLEGQAVSLDETGSQARADRASQAALAQALDADCVWIREHFESRKKQRQVELEGLQNARALLTQDEVATVNHME